MYNQSIDEKKDPLAKQMYQRLPWEETSSDEDGRKEGNEDADGDMHLLNSIRVIIRVRPLLQGESILQKRNVSNTSG